MRRLGFTVLEVLIALSILTLSLTAIYQTYGTALFSLTTTDTLGGRCPIFRTDCSSTNARRRHLRFRFLKASFRATMSLRATNGFSLWRTWSRFRESSLGGCVIG